MAAYAKPSGRQLVNRGDPLGRPMTAGWLFNGPTINGQTCVWDICGGVGATVANSPNSLNVNTLVSNPFSFVSSPFGTVLDRAPASGTPNRLLFNNGVNLNIPPSPTFTIVCRLLLRSMGVYGNIFTQDGAFGFFIRNAGGNVVDFYLGGDHNGATLLPSNTWVSIAIQSVNGALHYYYFDPSDGFNVDANSFTLSGGPGNTINNLFSDTGSEYFNGQADYLYFYNGTAIPQKMLERLMADPYSVVRHDDSWMKSSAGTSTVGKDDNLVWNVLQAIAALSQEKWNTRSLATKSSQEVWNARAIAGKASTELWNARSLVNKLDQMVWNVRTTIGKSSIDLWNVHALTSQTRQLVWNARSLVSPLEHLLWNVRTLTTKNNQVDWNVHGLAGKLDQLVWGARAVVAQTRQIEWNARALTGKNGTELWNDLVKISKDEHLVWNVRQAVNHALSELWGVRAHVTKNNQLLWNVLVIQIINSVQEFVTHIVRQKTLGANIVMQKMLDANIVRSRLFDVIQPK